MNSKEKQALLAKLIQELKDGKDEEEVKKEYLELFQEDSLSLDRPSGQEEESHDYEKENPLIVFAQENGALKALLDNIAIDLHNSDDDLVGQRMLKDEFTRLSEIHVHYIKKEKVLFEFLKKYDVSLEEIQKQDADVLYLVDKLNFAFQTENPYCYKKEIQEVSSLIRDNIASENHYLLPILDENLNEDELFYIRKRSDIFGYCLIRHRRGKKHI